MAKSTDQFGNVAETGIIEHAIGAVCLIIYLLGYAMFLMPFAMLMGLYWIFCGMFILLGNVVVSLEAVYYNFKDSWRD